MYVCMYIYMYTHIYIHIKTSLYDSSTFLNFGVSKYLPIEAAEYKHPKVNFVEYLTLNTFNSSSYISHPKLNAES